MKQAEKLYNMMEHKENVIREMDVYCPSHYGMKDIPECKGCSGLALCFLCWMQEMEDK